MLQFEFSDLFFEDLDSLKKEQVKLLAKVFELIEDIGATPFEGIGKPEPLKGDLSGYWSRRITDKHRIIYKIEGNVVKLVSCYGHYSDK